MIVPILMTGAVLRGERCVRIFTRIAFLVPLSRMDVSSRFNALSPPGILIEPEGPALGLLACLAMFSE